MNVGSSPTKDNENKYYMPQIDISLYISIIQSSLILIIFALWFFYFVFFYSFFKHFISLYKILITFFYFIKCFNFFNKQTLRYTDISFLHKY